MSIPRKQNYLFLSFIILTALTAILSYRFFQKKWLLLREAEENFSQKNFDKAIVLYHESLLKGPTTANLFVHLADSYVAVGNFSEGINYYRLYLEAHPKDLAVRLLFARALSWNGNIEEAEKEYQRILQESSKVNRSPRN